jgi:hypothetical protein
MDRRLLEGDRAESWLGKPCVPDFLDFEDHSAVFRRFSLSSNAEEKERTAISCGGSCVRARVIESPERVGFVWRRSPLGTALRLLRLRLCCCCCCCCFSLAHCINSNAS